MDLSCVSGSSKRITRARVVSRCTTENAGANGSRKAVKRCAGSALPSKAKGVVAQPSSAGLRDITNLASASGKNTKRALRPQSSIPPVPAWTMPLQPSQPVPVTQAIVQPVGLDEPIPEHRKDVQMVTEYAGAIYQRLFALERHWSRPQPSYMQRQAEINGKMRAILVDWMVEVHIKYKMHPETFFLSVTVLDRFLAKVSVPKAKLQLVGVAAMFIASKFEEETPPTAADLVYITDKACSQDDIFRAEVLMLNELSFDIVVATPWHFVDRLQRANGSDGVHNELVSYLLELSQLELKMIRHLPSMLAASAVLLGNQLLRRPSWPDELNELSRYSRAELQECYEELLALFEAAPLSSLEAVRKKYAVASRFEVSKLKMI